MQKLVSIIVPVYNVEKYLAQCIESLIRQSYKNIEILLIDDGSTDNSFALMKKLQEKDSRIKIFSKEQIILSHITPILHNIGFEIIDEVTYNISDNKELIYISKFNESL